MRIAWDVTPLSVPPTGIGRYIIGSLKGLAEARSEWGIQAIAIAESTGIDQVRRALGRTPSNVELKPIVRSQAWVTRRIASDLGWPRLERITGPVDAFIDSEWFRPSQRAGARVALVYDVIPLLFPEWVSPRTRRAHLRSLRRVGARADRIITISEATKRDLIEHVGIDPARITIAFPGVGAEFRDAAAEPPPAVAGRPYIVVVGTTNARKNLGLMLEGFRDIALQYEDLDLVVVGASDVDEPAILGAIDRLRLRGRVHRLGYVDDQTLAGIVAGAKLLVFPSLYEGFGMPVVEAMAAGVPVAASSAPSLDEACGDAADRFDPADASGLVRAVCRVIEDPRRAAELVQQGRLHASAFTWEAAGHSIARAVEAVQGEPTP
jgi:glycosyltransferase involved in cell wall biosynthesis